MYYFIFLIIIASKVVYSAHILPQETLNDGKKIISEEIEILPHRQRKIKDSEVEGSAYEDADNEGNVLAKQVFERETTSVDQLDFERSNFGPHDEFLQFEIKAHSKRTPLPEFPQFPSLLKVVQVPKPKVNDATKSNVHVSTTDIPTNKKARQGSKLTKTVKTQKRKHKSSIKLTTPHLPYYITEASKVVQVTIEEELSDDSVENMKKHVRDSNAKIAKSRKVKSNRQDDDNDELEYRGHSIKIQKDNPQPLKCKVIETNLKDTDNKDYDDNIVPRATSDKTDFMFYPVSDNFDENSYKIRNLLPAENIEVAVNSIPITEEPNLSEITPIEQVYDAENTAKTEGSSQKIINDITSSKSLNVGFIDPLSRDNTEINDLERFSPIVSTLQTESSPYFGFHKNDDEASIPHLPYSHEIKENAQNHLVLPNYENAMHERCNQHHECKKIGYQYSKPPKKLKHKSSKCKIKFSIEDPNLSQEQVQDQNEENIENIEDSTKEFIKTVTPSIPMLWNVELVNPSSTEVDKINDMKRQSFLPIKSTPSQYVDYNKNDQSMRLHFTNFNKLRSSTQNDFDLENYRNTMHERCNINNECRKLGFETTKRRKQHKYKPGKCTTKKMAKSFVRRLPNFQEINHLPSLNDLSDVPTIKKNSEFHPKSIVSILNSNNINDDNIFKLRYSIKDNQQPTFRTKIGRKNQIRHSNVEPNSFKNKHSNKANRVPTFQNLLNQINEKKDVGNEVDPNLLKFKYLNKPQTIENTNKINGKDEMPDQNVIDPNMLKVIYPIKIDQFPSQSELKRIDLYDKNEMVNANKIDRSSEDNGQIGQLFSNVELQKIFQSFKKNILHSDKSTSSDNTNYYIPFNDEKTTPTDDRNNFYISKYISKNAEQTDPDSDIIQLKYKPVIRELYYNKNGELHPNNILIEPRTLSGDSYSLQSGFKNSQNGDWKVNPLSETTTEDPFLGSSQRQLTYNVNNNLAGNNFKPEQKYLSKNSPHEPRGFHHIIPPFSKHISRTLEAPPTNHEGVPSKYECQEPSDSDIDEIARELMSSCNISKEDTTTQSSVEKSLLKYLSAHEAAASACQQQKCQDQAAVEAAASKARAELANKASEAADTADASVSDKQLIVNLYEELCGILEQVIELFEPGNASEEETSQNAVVVSQQHVDNMERALIMAKQIEKNLNQVSEYSNDLKEQNEMAVDTSRTRIHILQNKLSTAQQSLQVLEQKLTEINECKNRKKKKKFRLFPWKKD